MENLMECLTTTEAAVAAGVSLAPVWMPIGLTEMVNEAIGQQHPKLQ
jgi:hypothetical protein